MPGAEKLVLTKKKKANSVMLFPPGTFILEFNHRYKYIIEAGDHFYSLKTLKVGQSIYATFNDDICRWGHYIKDLNVQYSEDRKVWVQDAV